MLYCPICNQEMIRDTYTEYGVGVVEDYTYCPCGKYDVEFAYGNNRVAVGDREWIWSYTTSEDEVSKIQKEIHEEIKNIQTNSKFTIINSLNLSAYD